MKPSMIKLAVPALAAVGLMLPIRAASASQATVDFTGALCNPVNPTAASGPPTFVDYNKFGIRNASTASSVNVECGMSNPNNTTIVQVVAEVYDRSSVDDTSCQLWLTDLVGNTIYTQNDGTGGKNQSAAIPLVYSGGNFVGASLLFCHLPALTSSGDSYVSTYDYTYNF